MSEKSYTVRDRRGGKNGEPAEACRACGSATVHTREYNQPTMDCIRDLRGQVATLDGKCQEWARAMENAPEANVESYKKGLDMAIFLAKDSLMEAPTSAQDELLTSIVNTITDFKNKATIANVLNG